jgi:L,D-transpeptidase YcbB
METVSTDAVQAAARAPLHDGAGPRRQKMLARVALALMLGSALLAPAQAQTFSDQPPAAPPAGSFGGTPPVASEPPAATSPTAAPRRVVRRAPAPVRYAALPRDARPTFTTQSVVNTEASVRRYRTIVANGGWGRVTAGNQAAIRRRLQIEGDFDGGDLKAAVRKFQMRHGLRETGVVAGPTLQAMNVPAETRLAQLEASLNRMRSSGFGFGDRYVVVNIPAAAVEAVDGNNVRRRYVAVVGKSDRASPPVETRITNINFNPTWTVPSSIIKKDIIPKMQKDPGYLTRSKIRILDGRGREINPRTIDWTTEKAANYTLRQDPGSGNSLGQVRIDMPNNLAVYMHDTPTKGLFASDNRFHSSGCVRVADVRDLVTWLLEGNGSWSRRLTDDAIAEGERRDVRLARPVPVAWTYFTGYGMPDGSAHFRPDIYNLDSSGGGLPIAMRTAPRPTAPSPEPVPGVDPDIAPPAPSGPPSFWDLFRPR